MFYYKALLNVTGMSLITDNKNDISRTCIQGIPLQSRNKAELNVEIHSRKQVEYLSSDKFLLVDSCLFIAGLTQFCPSTSRTCPLTNRTTVCPPTIKRKSDVLYLNEPLSESKFDDIAAEISKSWKSIGRKLNVTEAELREIEFNYQHSGEKEKAFQMLIAWRERDPENCQLAYLYSVLCDSGMKYTAQKCTQ